MRVIDGRRRERRIARNADLCVDQNPAHCLHISAARMCASHEARIVCKRTCGPCRVHLPRIYLYPNVAWENGMLALSPGESSENSPPWALTPDDGTVFGSYIAPFLYQRLQQYAVPAEEADFFVSFQTPYMPPFANWTAADQAAVEAMGANQRQYMNNKDRITLVVACNEWLSGNSSLLRSLNHLTPLTEHRHIIIPKWHFGACGREFSEAAMARVPDQVCLILE